MSRVLGLKRLKFHLSESFAPNGKAQPIKNAIKSALVERFEHP